jgi:hypothetical protein
MLLLASTSDIIRVVTGTTGSSIQVHASWVDNASGTITPGRTNTAAIVTNTTTTVVAAPGASTQRNVKHLNITNAHATVATQVTVQHFDGTTSEDLMGVTLLPGENLVFDQEGNWVHHDVQGGEYTYAGPPTANLGMTGVLAETMPREICPEVNATIPTASGTLFMQAIYLKAGQLVSNIIVSSATTAAGTPTNGFAALYDSARNLLAQSANQTTTAWAANTVKTLAMTTPYRIPTSGLYYIGFMMAATTIITMKGGTAKTGGQLASQVPILHGTSSTGLTTSLPNPAAAITGGLVTLYAAVS